MEQSINNKRKSVEDLLAQSDIELTGNWPKLASLIFAYEGIEWEDAGVKARELLKGSRVPAIEYINEVRGHAKPPQKTNPENSKKKINNEQLPQSGEVANYKRLLKIAPDLPRMLLSGKAVYGKSKVTGYMDFNLELIQKNNRGYYVAISHYYKENGDLVADPDMVIRVDVENECLEALTFQDRDIYKEVYDNYMDPQTVRPKEKADQNAFLNMWFRNLIKQGHRVKFEEETKQEPVLKENTIAEEKPKAKKIIRPLEAGGQKRPDLSFMDETVISNMKEMAANMVLDDIIKFALEAGKKDPPTVRPIAQYFLIKRINDSPLGVTMQYPSQQELEDDYKKLVEEQERHKKIAESAQAVVIDDSNIADTAKHWPKLAAVIQAVEGVDYETAKEKALDLKKTGKAENYVVTAFHRKSASGVNQLYKLNYQLLVQLIPAVLQGDISTKSGAIQRKKADDPLRLNYEGMESISKTVHVLSIQETGKTAIQIMAIQRISKKIWLLGRNGNFNGTADYEHDKASAAEKLKANTELGNWLKVMLHYGFEEVNDAVTKSQKFEHPVAKLLQKYPIVIEWSEGSADENIGIESLDELQDKLKTFKYPKEKHKGYSKTKVWFRGYTWYLRIDLSKNEGDYYPNDMNLMEWLKNGDPNFDWEQFSKAKDDRTEVKMDWDEDVNQKIPDFEVGKVKLVEAHIKVGLDQQDIDWINKNQRGRTITPLTNMKNKTKNFEMDLKKGALSPGFRISKTGKLYRENRSNRSDLTNSGL